MFTCHFKFTLYVFYWQLLWQHRLSILPPIPCTRVLSSLHLFSTSVFHSCHFTSWNPFYPSRSVIKMWKKMPWACSRKYNLSGARSSKPSVILPGEKYRSPGPWWVLNCCLVYLGSWDCSCRLCGVAVIFVTPNKTLVHFGSRRGWLSSDVWV